MDLFFERDIDKEKQFKTGYILENDTRIPFKYHKLSRTDIRRLSDIHINIDQESLTIMTTSEYKFTTDTNLVINGFRYNISYMYEEDDPEENNQFNLRCSTKKYLVLIADR